MKGLKQLLKEGLLVAPGAFNAITAKLIEDAGFSAVYLSGAGVANSMTALPDIGLVTMTEVLAQARHVVNAVRIPVIVDIDTGFGEVHNIMRAVAEFRDVGVSAVHIEDQVFPKRCGHLDGKSLISVEEMSVKIAAAKKVSGDMLIIARTDARGVTGIDDAIARSVAYEQAGADIIFPEALLSIDEFLKVKDRLKIPVLANMTEFGKTPLINAEQFEGAADIVIFPMTLFRIMLKSLKEAALILKNEGTQKELLSKMLTRTELYEIVDYDKFNKLENDLTNPNDL